MKIKWDMESTLYAVEDCKWKVIMLHVDAYCVKTAVLGSWWELGFFWKKVGQERVQKRMGWPLWLHPDISLVVNSLPKVLIHSMADGLLKCPHQELCNQREGHFQKTNYRCMHSSRAHLAQVSFQQRCSHKGKGPVVPSTLQTWAPQKRAFWAGPWARPAEGWAHRLCGHKGKDSGPLPSGHKLP